MKCDPSEDGVVLAPESELEEAAIARWNGLAPWRMGDGRHYLKIEFLEMPPEPAPATPPPPENSRRTIRVPAIGQIVEHNDGGIGRVTRVDFNHGETPPGFDIGVRVNFHPTLGGWYAPEDLTPVGDDPRWITIELPEES